MIRYDFPQRSEKWYQARAGIPTASNFHKIITPGGKISTQAPKYMNFLLAEWAMGHAIQDTYSNEWMERGAQLEEEAVAAFEFDRGLDTEVVGFVTSDDGMIGCSPDRFAGEDEMVEIKCPKPENHMGYMLGAGVDGDYYPQLQGNLWLCERKVINISSYCPGLPSVIIPVKRDEEYIAKLSKLVTTFVEELLRARRLITERFGIVGGIHPKTLADVFKDDGLGDIDINAIWEARENK